MKTIVEEDENDEEHANLKPSLAKKKVKLTGK